MHSPSLHHSWIIPPPRQVESWIHHCCMWKCNVIHYLEETTPRLLETFNWNCFNSKLVLGLELNSLVRKYFIQSFYKSSYHKFHSKWGFSCLCCSIYMLNWEHSIGYLNATEQSVTVLHHLATFEGFQHFWNDNCPLFQYLLQINGYLYILLLKNMHQTTYPSKDVCEK